MMCFVGRTYDDAHSIITIGCSWTRYRSSCDSAWRKRTKVGQIRNLIDWLIDKVIEKWTWYRIILMIYCIINNTIMIFMACLSCLYFFFIFRYPNLLRSDEDIFADLTTKQVWRWKQSWIIAFIIIIIFNNRKFHILLFLFLQNQSIDGSSQ